MSSSLKLEHIALGVTAGYYAQMSAAIIIGAGPAGSVAALLLARSGLAVDLFESHQFPRNKVCGECLSGLGQDVLRRTGVLDHLLSVQPARLTRTILHPANGPSTEVPLPRASIGITRMRMDQLLLDAAKSAGVRVHQPARCESIAAGNRPRVIWRDLTRNVCDTTSADWIVVADGKGALTGSPGKSTGDLGIKAHFAGVNGPNDAVELFAGSGHYGGLAAVEDDRWNAAFSVPAWLVKKHAGDLQRVFDHIIDSNPNLQRRLSTAERVGPWLAAPLPRFAVSDRWPARLIPVGNAAAALEPVGGEGMGLALRSAELAADAITVAENTGNFRQIQRLPREFRSLWQMRRTVCRGIAILFSRPDLADAVAPLIAGNPGIPSALMRLAGKADVR